jgi:hypothetical protein
MAPKAAPGSFPEWPCGPPADQVADRRRLVAPNKEDARMENLATAVANIERRLNGFAEELKTARYWIIIAAIALAVAFYFRH